MFLARVADLPNFRCHNECHSRVLARDADADADAEYEKLSANGLWRPDLARPDTRRSWLVVRLSGVRFSEAAPLEAPYSLTSSSLGRDANAQSLFV